MKPRSGWPPTIRRAARLPNPIEYGVESARFSPDRDPAYLEPFRRDSGEIDGAISDFKALFRHEEAASATVNVILDLAQAKLAELAQTIALAETAGEIPRSTS